ncbi:hypothetical protein [Candidatus Enterococcus clewellii]|uniref:Uncharacterized protein n=1 Tax=Candidatus Enterococcus clewellii TaxID=1834193 RepID=A0A242KAR4_9ENTE|nr:hypothetical protein [Enterococcus sp. 9E7_DIV0242]OTP18265.1 hypothetical protein A5888_000079 [Enterococcus sp. 9E7_DIV0242]
MAEYEKDFMLRQAKQMADLLGSFMDKESIAENFIVDDEQSQKLKEATHKQLVEQLSAQTSGRKREKERSLIKRRLVK